MSSHIVTSDVVSKDPVDVYAGYNFLPLEIAAEGLVTNRKEVLANSNLSFLDQMRQMLSNPTSGSLGLAMAARYGGPNARVRGTNGQGIDMSSSISIFEQTMQDLAEFNSSLPLTSKDTMFDGQPLASDQPQPVASSAGPVAPSGIPANAPANTPTSGNTDWGPYMDALMYGGKVPLKSYKDGGTIPMSGDDRRLHNLGPQTEPTDAQLDKFGGRALIDAARANKHSGGNVEDFVNNIRNAERVGQLIASGSITPPNQNYGILSGGTQPPLPFNMMGQMDIRRLMEQYAWMLPNPGIIGGNAITTRPDIQYRQDGGGVTLAGAPHFIVDEKGNKIAALTEDGKPEEVKGVGGVEVIPLDPMRNALYESRKAQAEMSTAIAMKEEELTPSMKVDPNSQPTMTPDNAAKTANVMPAEVARLELGGFQMLPDQTIQGGIASPQRLPTQGGSSIGREEAIGPREDFSQGGASEAELWELLDAGDETDKAHYAKLLGAGLSNTNQAIDADILSAMNRGEAGPKLISGTDFDTMGASEQVRYVTMLKGMGIIDSAEDYASEVRRGTPTALS